MSSNHLDDTLTLQTHIFSMQEQQDVWGPWAAGINGATVNLPMCTATNFSDLLSGALGSSETVAAAEQILKSIYHGDGSTSNNTLAEAEALVASLSEQCGGELPFRCDLFPGHIATYPRLYCAPHWFSLIVSTRHMDVAMV